EKPLCYLVRRGKDEDCLDYHLGMQASAAGVRILYGTSISDSEADIVSTGTDPLSLGIAYGISCKTAAAPAAAFVLSNRFAPQGYAYLAILNNLLTIAVTFTKDFRGAKSYLQKSIEFFTKEFGLRIEKPEYFSCVGNVG